MPSFYPRVVLGFPFFLRFSATPGNEQTRPQEANVQRSPLAELGTASVLSTASHRAAVWVGRGATARPREAEWRSGVAAVFWGCYKKKYVHTLINLDITTTTEEHYVHNNDKS